MNAGVRFYGALFLADQVTGVVLVLGSLLAPGAFWPAAHGAGLVLLGPLLVLASVVFAIWSMRNAWPARLLVLPAWHLGGLVVMGQADGEHVLRLSLHHSVVGLWVGACVLASLGGADEAAHPAETS
jgi:hypothetical protein